MIIILTILERVLLYFVFVFIVTVPVPALDGVAGVSIVSSSSSAVVTE